jgi:GGDEF domain-containing protein
LGGDEFGIILPEIDRLGVAATGEKLAADIATALSGFAPVSASIGVAWFERVGADFETLIREADLLMYTIKRGSQGGLKIRHFSNSPRAVSATEMESVAPH